MRVLITSVICVALGAADLPGQLLDFSAYYFNAASAAGSSPVRDASVSDFQRIRLMWAPDIGPLSFDIAYEQALTLSSTGELGRSSAFLAPQARVNWWTLEWMLDEGDHFSWRHRFDRLSFTLPLGGATEITVGRQVISWASTLIFTPADPFTPFEPADPFREYRAGVDAFRFQAYLGAFSEIDIVVRPVTTLDGDQITALARGKMNWRGIF